MEHWWKKEKPESEESKIKKIGYAVLPTTKEVSENGLNESIKSIKQELTIVKSYINIDQIVPLLVSKEPQDKIRLEKMVKALVPGLF